MKTSDFDYDLPRELIAQTPAEPRDSSRMMAVSLRDGTVRHRRFRDLPDMLGPGDVLVFNDSRVFPARLYGRRRGASGRVGLLLLSRLPGGRWRALTRPGQRTGAGTVCELPHDGGVATAEVLEVEPGGARIVRLSDEGIIDRIGSVPLPPYIREPLGDAERYQTVYARAEGSVAPGSATRVSLHGRWGYADRPGAAPPRSPRSPQPAGGLQRRPFGVTIGPAPAFPCPLCADRLRPVDPLGQSTIGFRRDIPCHRRRRPSTRV